MHESSRPGLAAGQSAGPGDILNPLRELLARRPYKVAMVAFAAKTARIIWAMLAKGEAYRDRASASAAA